MENVYAQIDKFYKNNDSAEKIITKNIVDTYFRKKAWRRADEKQLKNIWHIIENMLGFFCTYNKYNLERINSSEYHLVLIYYSSKHQDTIMDEKISIHILDTMLDFAQYLEKQSIVVGMVKQITIAKKLLYSTGEFKLPNIELPIPFDATMDDLTPEDMFGVYDIDDEEPLDVSDLDRLDEISAFNENFEDIQGKIIKFFQRPKYNDDLHRAMLMLFGKLRSADFLNDIEKSRFFWDYFLFDYHLIASDKKPLQYYYDGHYNNMSGEEQQLLADLLKAKFAIYSIDKLNNGDAFCDYRILCNELFSDKVLQMPLLDDPTVDLENTLIFGHVINDEIMLLGCVSIVKVSARLKKRIKEVILHLYKMFMTQMPKATLDDFMDREAVAVRQVLRIMSSYAQLNLVPNREIPKPIKHAKHLSKTQQNRITQLLKQNLPNSMSKYERDLIGKIFWDYVEQARVDVAKNDDMDKFYLLTGASMLFLEINGMLLLEKLPPAENEDDELIRKLAIKMRKTLHTRQYDPRYLSEAGFLRMLYN